MFYVGWKCFKFLLNFLYIFIIYFIFEFFFNYFFRSLKRRLVDEKLIVLFGLYLLEIVCIGNLICERLR